MLIIIKNAEISGDIKTQLLLLNDEDAVVLMKDGVYQAQQLSELHCPCFMYSPDAEARGVRYDKLPTVDDQALVALSHSHSPWVSW